MQYKKITKQIMVKLLLLDFLIQSGATFSTATFQDTKKHLLKENQSYTDGIEVKNKTTVENEGNLSVSSDSFMTHAIKASEGSTVTLKGSTIPDTRSKSITLKPKGVLSAGLYAVDKETKITADTIDITTKGDNSRGVIAENEAMIEIKNSTITGNGEFSEALLASGKNAHLTGNNMEIQANDPYNSGVESLYGAKVNIQDSSITGNNTFFYGFVGSGHGEDTNMMINNVNINANAENSKGVIAREDTTVISIEDRTITGNHDAFEGLHVYGEKTNLTGNKIKIEANGKKSQGIKIYDGETISPSRTAPLRHLEQVQPFFMGKPQIGVIKRVLLTLQGDP